VDIVVRGEGEYTMLELANYFIRGIGSLGEIRGIAYKSNGRINRTAVRPIIEDLDKLPFPERDIPDLEGILNPREGKNVIITSRGCPGKCKFCAASALAGGKYRMRSVDNIADEIADFKRNYKDLENIFFGDDTISADVSRLLDLCKMLKTEDVTWSAESRVDAMTKELAATLKNSGCLGIQFGVESGSQKLLDSMGKNITLEQIIHAVKCAVGAGLGVICSMMIGLPEDTEETIEQTLDFAERLQTEYKAGVVLASTVPYPGTYYFRHADDLNLRISTRNYDQYTTIMPIMDTPHLTRWQIRNLYFKAYQRLNRSLPDAYKNLFITHGANALAKAALFDSSN